MLQQSMNHKGVVLPSAIIRPVRATFTNADVPSVNVVVAVYADINAWESGLPPLFQQELKFAMTEPNHKALFQIVLDQLNTVIMNMFPGSTLVEEEEETPPPSEPEEETTSVEVEITSNS